MKYTYNVVPGKKGKGTKVILMKGSPGIIYLDTANQSELKTLYDMGQPFVYREEKRVEKPKEKSKKKTKN